MRLPSVAFPFVSSPSFFYCFDLPALSFIPYLVTLSTESKTDEKNERDPREVLTAVLIRALDSRRLYSTRQC
jgi:hypothetical protein